MAETCSTIACVGDPHSAAKRNWWHDQEFRQHAWGAVAAAGLRLHCQLRGHQAMQGTGMQSQVGRSQNNNQKIARVLAQDLPSPKGEHKYGRRTLPDPPVIDISVCPLICLPVDLWQRDGGSFDGRLLQGTSIVD
jgi:hypothetical protein